VAAIGSERERLLMSGGQISN